MRVTVLGDLRLVSLMLEIFGLLVLPAYPNAFYLFSGDRLDSFEAVLFGCRVLSYESCLFANFGIVRICGKSLSIGFDFLMPILGAGPGGVAYHLYF